MKSKQLEDEKGVKVVMPTANVDQGKIIHFCDKQIERTKVLGKKFSLRTINHANN